MARIFATLRRRAGLILLCLALTTLTAIGVSLLQQKQYSASASLLFRNPGFAEDLFGSGATPTITDPAREAATNQKLVGLDVVAERTAQRLRGVSFEEVVDMVTTSGSGEAEVVSVTAASSRPAQARLVANMFARQFIAFRAAADRSKLLQAKRLAEEEFDRLPPAQQAGVRGTALSQGAEKLGILASLQTGNAELVQPASLPTSPSSPRPLRNSVLAAIVGLLLGIGLAFLLEQLNRRLRDPEEAQEAFDMPILGTVPESKAIMTANEGASAELPFSEYEAFRMLRASLRYFNIDRDMRSVLITSSTAGVGKTTVAWNLARAAATSSKVILLETDLRNPTLFRQHGFMPGPGLAEVLTHQSDIDDAIQSQPLSGTSSANGAQAHLDVIVSGSLPPNPAELIESEKMVDVLSQLSERYDLVVIDTAPIGVVSDAIPLLHRVGGVIVVARMDTTTRDNAERIKEQLDRLDAAVLGVVANGVKVRRREKYGYGAYGDQYGQPPEEPGDKGTAVGASAAS